MRSVMIAVVLLSALTFAQDHPSVTAQPGTVYVGADGKFEAAPDTAQIQFSISAQENKSKAAYASASKNVEQVREVLRGNGVDPKAATIGFFSVQPIYQGGPKQKIVAYRVTTDVTLKLKDFSKVGPITEQLADANVSETQSVNYVLQDMDEAKNKAVEDAYRRARNSADTLAHASGRALGDLSYASIDTFEAQRPVPRMRSFAMLQQGAVAPAPTEEFTPQSVTVTAHVNAVFNLK